MEAQLMISQAKQAFENGKYRQCLDYLNGGLDLGGLSLEAKGDAKLWLVMTHQALGELDQALSLCQQLTKYPSYTVQKEARRLLGILQAPQLRRPEEWVTKVPTFDGDREPKKIYGAAGQRGARSKRQPDNPYSNPQEIPEDAVLDNSFVTIAIAATLLLFGFFVLLG
jgi:hypothetical protein